MMPRCRSSKKLVCAFRPKKRWRFGRPAGPKLIGTARSSAPKRALIEEALKKCPPAYTLAARDPQQDLPLDGNHVFVGTDGCGVEVIDIHTGERARRCLAGCGRHRPHRRCHRGSRLSLGAGLGPGYTRRKRAACTRSRPSGKTPPSTSRPRAFITNAKRGRPSKWQR